MKADALYKSEAEIAEIVGISTAVWSENARLLERDGLIKRDPMFENKRYWPKVRQFLDARNMLGAASAAVRRGEEHLEEEHA